MTEIEPVRSSSPELTSMTLPKLKEVASQLGIEGAAKMKKDQLAGAIADLQAKNREEAKAEREARREARNAKRSAGRDAKEDSDNDNDDNDNNHNTINHTNFNYYTNKHYNSD